MSLACKHSYFVDVFLTRILLLNAGNNCNLSLLSTATSTSNGNNSGCNGLNSAFTNSAFTNTAFTIAPLNRPGLSASATPCSVMSYPSNGPMSLASMATCVKPTPLTNSAGFVKVEGGGTYYGGGYTLAHAATDNSNLSPCSSAPSVCLSSLPFSHESYQLTTGHGQATTGPLLAVDANLRPFSTPTTAAIPYIACDQCTSTGTGTTPLPHPTVLYNWAHQPVPVGSTTVLNHASFGLMSAHTPPPSAPSQQCSSNVPSTEVCNRQTAGDALQSAQQEQDTNSPHESGYYSSTTSPTPNGHHRYVGIQHIVHARRYLLKSGDISKLYSSLNHKSMSGEVYAVASVTMFIISELFNGTLHPKMLCATTIW